MPSGATAMAVVIGQSWRAARRHHLWRLLLAASFFLVLGSGVLADFDFGPDPLLFLLDFGFGVSLVLGTTLAILLPTQQWFDAVEGRAAAPVLARPCSRGVLLLGYFGGGALALGAFLLGLTLVLGISAAGAVQSWGSFLATLLIQGWLHWVRVVVILSLFFFFGAYLRSRLLAASATFGLVAAAQLSSTAALWLSGRPESVATALVSGVLRLLPDFSIFTLSLGAVLEAGTSLAGLFLATLYGLLYATLYLAAGVYLFGKREW